MQSNKKLKVGFFVLIAVGLAAFGILKLGDINFSPTYSIFVYFDDVSGLTKKSPVKTSGVEIGKVRAVALEGGKARIEVAIRQGVTLYRDAKARVGSTGIIGTKYLDLTQGTPSHERLKAGDAISGVTLLAMEESVSRTLESVRGLTESIRGPHGDDLGRNVNIMIANLGAMTASLRELFEDRKKDVSVALISLRRIAGGLSEIVDKTDRILAKVEHGDGAVGALLVDKKVSEDVRESTAHLREASAGAAEMFGRFTRIRSFWDYRFRYDTKAAIGRSDFGIRLSPRPSKYYYLGVSNIADSKSPVKTNDFEKRTTFDVGMGKEVTPWFDVRAGLIRSEGGVGARVTPFYSVPLAERLSLQAEAYSFGRQTTLNSRDLRGPVYNVGLAAQVFPWLMLEARGEDMAQTKHFYGGARFTLEDKDLAYLLGLLTVTK